MDYYNREGCSSGALAFRGHGLGDPCDRKGQQDQPDQCPLPGIAVDAPGVVSWRYKRDQDLFGVCDSMLCRELLIESKYYSVDERFELTGEKGVIWVMKCTADMLKVPAVMMYTDGKLSLTTLVALFDDV